jgi:hypothetical protein
MALGRICEYSSRGRFRSGMATGNQGGTDSCGIELEVEGGDDDYGMELTMNHQTVNRRF